MTSNALVPAESQEVAAPKLFEGATPSAIVAAATETANALSGVLEKQRLYSTISGRKHVRVEGWTLLGTLTGVFPYCVWTRRTEDPKGWEARVEARTLHGDVVGAAEASCTRAEKTWANRDDYALRSMAQTRATSKALRQPLGFIVTLAGFDATPAEEMGHEEERPQQRKQRATPPAEEQVIEGEVTEVPKWWDDFKAAAKSMEITGADLEAVLGKPPTKGAVEAWVGDTGQEPSDLLVEARNVKAWTAVAEEEADA